jgi:hypothetical protein
MTSLKTTIYRILRLWNDVDAVRKGRIGKRLRNKAVGRATGRLMKR